VWCGVVAGLDADQTFRRELLRTLGGERQRIVSRIVRDLDDQGRLLWIPETKTEAGKRTLPIPEVLQPYLQKIARRKGPTDSLFGQHWRDWPWEWLRSESAKRRRCPK